MKLILSYLINLFSKSNFFLKVFQIIIDEVYKKTYTVNHNKQTMLFSVPNHISLYRSKTFKTKEPDTLIWIEQIPKDAVLWDIGANVGIYSIYAAKNNKCSVYSFEPSVFNLELLARNINNNSLQDLITIVPLPITNRLGIQKFKMNNPIWGGALSTFGENFDQFGDPLNESKFEYSFPGLSMDEVIDTLNIEPPNYIKIDVDGIEHLILEGGSEVLKSVDSILLEVNDNFAEQSKIINKRLIAAGFSLYKKCDMGDKFFFNQWWIRELN